MSYEERKAARIERLKRRAERLRAEGAARIEQADKMASVIPFGQPILVGHHSEGRDRRYRERIRGNYSKGAAALREAEVAERRARTAEANVAISSDDPEALDKLRAKLAELERQHAVILEVNKKLRRGAALAEVAPLLDWWEDPLRRLEIIRSLGHKTLPTTNGSAEMRRVKGRIAELEARAAAPARQGEEIGSVRIEESENRVRLFFPGKPSAEVRDELKRSGFRWSPSAGAWQAYVSERAWARAREIARKAGA